ncbi:winged helix-turn-helix transcriptional regulator [Peribacillus aracenensis]
MINEIQMLLPGISKAILTRQVREFEEDQIITVKYI